MASADLYGACVTFLDGDSGDVRTAINAEFTGLLAAGSVYLSRSRSGKLARRPNAGLATVEIVPVTAPRDRNIGIGWVERDQAFELAATVRVKTTPDGKAQFVTPEKALRALVARYHEVSNLVIPVTGTLATFAHSTAEVVTVDRDSDVTELHTAVMRAVFTFIEQEASTT